MASDVGESTNWQPHSESRADGGNNDDSDSMKSQHSGESTESKPQNPSGSGDGNNDAGDFECNICLDLAKDPVVTLCGHLFCWPCLYRWLRHHSHSQECPVCKALVLEEKLVPLYGRGKTQSDPRSRPVPGIDIPNRPVGQRPETAQYNNPNVGFGLFGGMIPMATASFGGISISAGFSNLFPSVHVHVQGSPPNAAVYGVPPGYGYGGHNAEVPQADASRGGPAGNNNNDNSSALSKMFLLFGAVVVLFLSWGSA